MSKRYSRTPVSKSASHFPTIALVLWLVFASLEAFSTRTILRHHQHGHREIAGISLDHRREFAFVSDWKVEHPIRRPRSERTVFFMGKGFNRARNKQAELAKKMAIAKSQNQEKAVSDSYTAQQRQGNKEHFDSDQEGRKDFEELLRTTKGAIPSADDTDSAYIAPIEARSKIKTKKVLSQAPKKRKKYKRNTEETVGDRDQVLFEAKRRHFESLIEVGTSAPLGPIGAASLVPWVPPFLKKGLIIFVDPRSNSKALRRTIRYHASSSIVPESSSGEVDISFVTADSLGETQSWLKRNKIDLASRSDSDSSQKLLIFCDPGLSFTTTYEIVGDSIDHRWSMAMLAFDTKGDLVRMERDVEPSRCAELVASAMKDLDAS